MSNNMKNTIIGALLGFVFFVCLAAKSPVIQDIIQMRDAKPSSQYIKIVETWQNKGALTQAINNAKNKGYQIQQITGNGNSSAVIILFVKY